jgi:TM2 domain-containing membrane protein YozV
MAVSPKSRLATTLLAFFIGQFGAHRFYIGKIGTAVTMLALIIIGYVLLIVAVIGPSPVLLAVGYILVTAVGIWAFVDFIIAVIGKMKDKQGNLITKW